MNLKQFNFYSTRTSELSFGRKKTAWLGFHKHLQKRREKERKREERGGYFVTQAHNKNVPSSTNRRPRRSETKFSQRERKLYSFTQKRGKGRQKRERVSVSFSF
jgi:hypothetical protein